MHPADDCSNRKLLTQLLSCCSIRSGCGEKRGNCAAKGALKGKVKQVVANDALARMKFINNLFSIVARDKQPQATKFFAGVAPEPRN